MKILIIARHYPPEISGGSRRPALLASGLRELGHDVTVAAPIQQGQGEVTSDVQIPLGTFPLPNLADPISTPLNRIKHRIAEQIRIPDGERVWSNHALNTLRNDADISTYDVVFTTSPPESVHAIGFALRQAYGINWVADLRDNWLAEPLLNIRKRPLRRKIERHLAKTWLAAADLITAPTFFILKEVEDLVPATPRLYLPQPVEPGLLAKSPPKYPNRLVHAGQFSLSDPNGRKITDLLEAFSSMATTHPNLELHLLGHLTATERQQCQSVPGVHLIGTKSRSETLSYLQQSAAAIVVARPESQAVPGKIFEYVAIGRPIIFAGDGPWLDEVGVTRPLPDLVSQIRNVAEKSAVLVSHRVKIHTPQQTAHLLSERLIRL